MKIMLSLFSLFLGCRLSVGPPLERAAAAKSSLARFARLSIYHPKRVRRGRRDQGYGVGVRRIKIMLLPRGFLDFPISRLPDFPTDESIDQ